MGSGGGFGFEVTRVSYEICAFGADRLEVPVGTKDLTYFCEDFVLDLQTVKREAKIQRAGGLKRVVVRFGDVQVERSFTMLCGIWALRPLSGLRPVETLHNETLLRNVSHRQYTC